MTIKFSPNGDSLWKIIEHDPNTYTNQSKAISVDSEGNVYVSYKAGIITTGEHYVTIKYNTFGQKVWEATYTAQYEDYPDYPMASVIGSDNSVYVTFTVTRAGTAWDYATVKYNSLGIQQWAAYYDFNHSAEIVEKIALDRFDNVYITGGSAVDDYEYCTVKYNLSGIQQWVQRFQSPDNMYSYAYDLSVDNVSNVYVTGEARYNATYVDCVTIKYNTNGIQQWIARYTESGTNTEVGQFIRCDSLRNIYVAGYKNNSNFDLFMIKYDSNGTQKYLDTYSGQGTGNDYLSGLVLDTNYGIYLTASTFESSNYDITSIKYRQVVGISANSNSIDNFSLFQNYPNPFNPITRIKFRSAKIF